MKGPIGCATLVAGTLLLAGLGLLGASAWTAWLAADAQSWQSTEGSIESVIRDEFDNPIVTYSFMVGNTVYRSTKNKLGLIGPDPKPPREGEPFKVYFDPKRPEHCALNTSADLGALVGACIAALVFLLIPGFFTLYGSRRPKALPPSDSAVSPAQGAVSYQPPSGSEMTLGRVGKTRLNVETWEPGKTILIIQKRTWKFSMVIGALVFVTLVFFVAHGEGIDMSWEKIRMPFLVWGVVLVLPAVLLSWPSHPGSFTINWLKDTILVKSGRSERLLGLRRVCGIDLRRKATAGTSSFRAKMKSKRKDSFQIVVWVKPDGGETVPFLLASTRERSLSQWHDSGDLEAVEQFAQALASQMNVPFGQLRNSLEPFK